MQILSVDLALTSYANLGIIILEEEGRRFVARPVPAREFGLTGETSPQVLANSLAKACEQIGISILLLDGPQGWKHPDNGLEHSRVCERELNTPGKTGLPGYAKPANYLPFITLSITVFQTLVAKGFGLLGGSPADCTALESFPRAAWKALGVRPLPAKKKATRHDLGCAADSLRRLFPVQFPEGMTHDELQALVAAFAGVAYARGCKAGYTVAGVAPSHLGGSWREGFIINPTREALALQASNLDLTEAAPSPKLNYDAGHGGGGTASPSRLSEAA